MSETSVIDFAMQSILLTLVVSMPPIVVASVIGLVISFIQAVTQLQEQTFAFGVKLVGVALTLILLGPWMSMQLYTYAIQIFESFFIIVR